MVHCTGILNNDHWWHVLVSVINNEDAKQELGSGVSMTLFLG